jgi:hypothetical protein
LVVAVLPYQVTATWVEEAAVVIRGVELVAEGIILTERAVAVVRSA